MEYIPGYITLKNMFGKSPYELFVDSASGTPWPFVRSNSQIVSSNIDDTKIPTWSSTIQYAKGNNVKMGGILYTSVKDSLGISPILSMNGDYINVNSEFWKYLQVSPAVKVFTADTDAKKTYFMNTIVNFDDVLYQCKNTSNQCTTDFTKSEWQKLTSAIVTNPTAESVKKPYTDSIFESISASFAAMSDDFSIEDIPDESWSDKLTRIFYVVYPYVLSIITFFLAIIIAAYSANDLLHKPALFRVLAFAYVFYFLYPLGAFSPIILSYYLYRCFLGPLFWPDTVYPPLFKAVIPIWEDSNYNESAIFPTLFTYPATWEMKDFIRTSKDEFNRDRLSSHGDIKMLLANALHKQIWGSGMDMASTPQQSASTTVNPVANLNANPTANPTSNPNANPTSNPNANPNANLSENPNTNANANRSKHSNKTKSNKNNVDFPVRLSKNNPL